MISYLVLISYALSALASPVMLHDGNAGNGSLFEDIMIFNKDGARECRSQVASLSSILI